MQKKTNRFVLIVIALVVGALVLTDLLPAMARESVAAAPAVLQQHDGRILVAQEQPRRRRTLMDLLFGDEQEQRRQEQPVIEKPVVRKPRASAPAPAAALPPAKPKIEKAEGATRLAVFGDSLANDVASALDRFYEEDPNLMVIAQGVGSSGIVRTDFFDWPKAISAEIEKDSFDIAVFIIGINDRQKLNIGGTSYGSLSPEWTVEYSGRVSRIVQELRAANKPTIWIGLPPMEAPTFGKTMFGINEVQRLAVFGGGAEFLDIYPRFADENGKYASRGPDLNGNNVRMRRDDGIHFSAAGADKLAFYLSQTLRNYYRGGGTVGLQVADPLLGTDAQMMLRPPYQGLGQMKLLEVAGAVISLTHAPRRAAELVSSSSLSAEADDALAVGFDMTMMLEAPVGRADAFGVGRVPEVPEVAEVAQPAALAVVQ